MTSPANPHAAEAAAAWREAMQAAGVISAPPVAADTPPIPTHALALYPWLAKYAATARVETLTIQNAHTGRWEYGQCVTVTIK